MISIANCQITSWNPMQLDDCPIQTTNNYIPKGLQKHSHTKKNMKPTKNPMIFHVMSVFLSSKNRKNRKKHRKTSKNWFWEGQGYPHWIGKYREYREYGYPMIPIPHRLGQARSCLALPTRLRGPPVELPPWPSPRRHFKPVGPWKQRTVRCNKKQGKTWKNME